MLSSCSFPSSNSNLLTGAVVADAEPRSSGALVEINGVEEPLFSLSGALETTQTIPSFNNTGANVSISCFTNSSEGVTLCDLNHYNFSLRFVANRTNTAYNLSAISLNVENSIRTLGVSHNKTSIVYPGDIIDYQVKASNGTFVDILFLNRNMFVYNKTGEIKNISAANANTSSCKILTNSSTFSSASCTISNDDITMQLTFIADDNNTHPLIFFNAENTGQTTVTLIEYYNYLDCDATVKPGYDGRDDLITLIKHPITQFQDQEEQISKEAYVVCDTRGLSPEADLSKCDTTVNDTFYVMQKLGSGTPNPNTEIFCGFSTKYTPVTRTNILGAFANPSTDTDNSREVPPAKLLLAGNDPMDKSDIVLVANLQGTVLNPGEKFVKYFGLMGSSSATDFSRGVDENVTNVPISIVDDKIFVKNSTGQEVSRVGAYMPLNITLELANTAGEDYNDISYNCSVNSPNGNQVTATNSIINITAKETAKIMSCGTLININNSLAPGNYTITANAKTTINEELATGSFEILSDYVGVPNVTLDSNIYACDRVAAIKINATNRGNTNFTGNITVNLFLNNSLVKNIVNYSNQILVKDGQNFTTYSYTVSECTGSGNYSVRANLTTVDAKDGRAYSSDEEFYYNDNIFPTISYAQGLENNTAIFKRLRTLLTVADDYALDICTLELQNAGPAKNYTASPSAGSCAFDVNLTSAGKYTYRVYVNDTLGHVNLTQWKNLTKFSAPNLSEFSGSLTTNLEMEDDDAYNTSAFTLETSLGKITWLSGISLVDQNLQAAIDILNNFIEVKSLLLHSSCCVA